MSSTVLSADAEAGPDANELPRTFEQSPGIFETDPDLLLEERDGKAASVGYFWEWP
jgi:hypothetical protein